MPNTNKPLQYRPHIVPTSDSYRRIRSHKCWHFDAWLCRAGLGELFLLTEARRGGRLIRTRPMPNDVYRVAPNGTLHPCNYGALYAGGEVLQVTIDALEGTARDAALTVHRAYVMAWADRVPFGFTSRSVCLHYWPIPDSPAIAEGTMNYCVKGGALAGPVRYPSNTVEKLPDIFA